MIKHKVLNFILVVLTLLFCCSSEDDNATTLATETNADTAVLTQNSQVEIFIFANDSNIPQNGTLTISAAALGTIQIQNNNTPNNPSDDYMLYVANPNIVGEETFQYTICDNSNNCYTENVTVNITTLSVVNIFENDTPHQTLSAYNFFQGELKDLNPTFGVVPYDLISPLFSDYANKKRFIWMPNGVKANYVEDYEPLDFPEGTILIKNFYYNNVQPGNTTRLLETRLMYKKADEWDFANYIWNEEQTEAFFSNQGSIVNLNWLEDNNPKSTDYRIPSRAECFTCHNQLDDPSPIGMKPQNLNRSFDYTEGIANQLQKLVEIGYLNNNVPGAIDTVVAWDDESYPLESRVRSYLDINCAHCHSDQGHCNYRPMRFANNLTTNIENIGVCVEPDTQFIPNSYIVKPNDTDLSILFYRISTTDETFRMPLLGRSINHEEGIRLIDEWINSLNNCD
ncbi:Ig-like domain-containing protein [Winogradskyella tangerina]|uniref:Ig-like domain-containing protein n=1 Tax=Winogradskyella tangerina TaxID=2023240 RepID=UPI000DBE8650|nr:hypothetical protein [Winogradskyella tangerina]